MIVDDNKCTMLNLNVLPCAECGMALDACFVLDLKRLVHSPRGYFYRNGF